MKTSISTPGSASITYSRSGSGVSATRPEIPLLSGRQRAASTIRSWINDVGACCCLRSVVSACWSPASPPSGTWPSATHRARSGSRRACSDWSAPRPRSAATASGDTTGPIGRRHSPQRFSPPSIGERRPPLPRYPFQPFPRTRDRGKRTTGATRAVKGAWPVQRRRTCRGPGSHPGARVGPSATLGELGGLAVDPPQTIKASDQERDSAPRFVRAHPRQLGSGGTSAHA